MYLLVDDSGHGQLVEDLSEHVHDSCIVLCLYLTLEAVHLCTQTHQGQAPTAAEFTEWVGEWSGQMDRV